MSVQLVLYPQETTRKSLLVDAQSFNTINSAPNASVMTTSNNFAFLMDVYPPSYAGQWRVFKNIASGAPAYPSQSNGNLLLNTVTTISSIGTFTGVYQTINGLTQGEQYTLTINMVAATGNIFLGFYNGVQGTNFIQSANTTQLTQNFTATATSNTVFIAYLNNANTNLTINSMTFTGADLSKDWQGQVVCDLYEDEEIPLTLSVDDFKNVAEKVQSYSKDFNLPATKRNNKIFGNIFEITRTVSNPYDFNPYANTRALLKQDGVVLFDGALKLIDIQERDGEISYNVNLFAQTIALADILKERTFADIDFSELDHTYNRTTITNSWLGATPLTNALLEGSYAGTAGNTSTAVLKYPFVDWTGQIYMGNGSNTGSTANTPNLNRLEDAFRPFIRITYLLNRIFSEAGFTFSSTVTDFKGLYMDFNWGGNAFPALATDTSFATSYDFSTGAATFFTDENFITIGVLDSTMTGGLATSQTPPDYQTSGANIYKIVATQDNQLYEVQYSWSVFNDLTNNDQDITIRAVHYDDSAGTFTGINLTTVNVNKQKNAYITGSFSMALDTDDQLYFEMKGQDGFVGSTYARISTSRASTVTYNVSSILSTSSTLNNLRGEINQWDFVKGLMTMFNLVSLQDPNEPANIILKPYSEVFIKTTSGSTLEERNIKNDWTHKVDLKDIKLTPLNDLNKNTVFKYEEDDDDYVFNMYKRSTRGHLYGSKVFDASGLTLLQGTEEIVASPFAATVSKPLFPQLSDFIVPSIYTLNRDGTTENFDNKPRILFDFMSAGGIELNYNYYIPAQNGDPLLNHDKLFTFSHLTAIPTEDDTTDYNFGEQQLFEPIGEAPVNNLFNTYWLPYYNELYNPNTKTMTLKVNLSAGDIASFKFTDYVMIKNRAYRVNRIDYKPKDLSTVEFILIA